MPTAQPVSHIARVLAAAAVVLGGSLLAQIPASSTSSSTPPAPAARAAATGAGAAASAPARPVDVRVAGGTAARTIVFDQSRRAGGQIVQVAQLKLIVDPPQAAHGCAVRLTYVAATDGNVTTQIRQGAPQRVVSTHPALFSDRSTPVACRGHAVALPLRFALPLATTPGAADGELQVDAGGARATISVAGSAAQITNFPNPVKMQVTRVWGPLSTAGSGRRWLLGRTANVQLLGYGAGTWSKGLDVQTTLVSDGGRELPGTLSSVDAGGAPSRGQAAARFHVDAATHVGAYAGAALLDPAAVRPQQVAVDVKVQDGIWWPLFVLLVSAGVGGYGVQRYNLRRRRDVLRAALKQPIEAFQATKRPSGLYRPKLPRVPFPTSAACGQAVSLDPIPQLYCEIDGARGDAEFDALADRVAEAIAPFECWHVVAHAYRRLRRALTRRRARRLPDGDPAVADARALLDEASVDPQSAKLAGDLAMRMEGQALVLHDYARLRAAWDALDDEARVTIADYDPETVYAKERARDAAGVLRLRVALRQALGRVRFAAAQPREQIAAQVRPLAEQPEEERVVTGATLLGSIQAMLPLNGGSERVEAATTAQRRRAATAQDTRSARRILMSLRRWDLVIAAGTALVATLAYLIPVYTKTDTFGSWSDYLLLMTVGFLGASVTGGLVLDWQLFPSLRSYGLQPASRPSTTDGGDDGSGGGGSGQPVVAAPSGGDGAIPAAGSARRLGPGGSGGAR